MEGTDVSVEISTARGADFGATETDVCTLAAALPPENLCSLICDPDAMKQRLRDSGTVPGRCYEFDCVLTSTQNVYVGVCLAPDSRYLRPAGYNAGSLSHT